MTQADGRPPTARPWKIAEGTPWSGVAMEGDQVIVIFRCYYQPDEANAAHIVHCVNSHDALEAKAALHDDLVAALRIARSHLVTLGGPRYDQDGDEIQAAVLNQVDAVLARVRP